MKTICFDRNIDGSGTGAFSLIADSSLTPPGRPVFLPDFGSGWVAEIYLAARISRLGKNIAMKFAPRYFDSLTAAMRLVAATDPAIPADFNLLLDNALTLGAWQPADSIGGDTAEFCVNDEKVTVNDPTRLVSEAIVELGRYSTLKTGDIILPVRLVAPIPVEIGTAIAVSVNSMQVIDLKIK